MTAGETPKAAATATALVPDDAVSPAPRSQTRASIVPSPTRRATWTFVRCGNRSCVSSSGPIRSRSSGSPSTTACGIPDVHSDEADAVELLGRRDGHVAQILLDPAVGKKLRGDFSRADTHGDPGRPGPLREPSRSDARAVARHLRPRAVGIPDRDLHHVFVVAAHLEHAVGVAHRRAHGAHGLRLLSDQVDVALRVPARRSHPQAPRQAVCRRGW